MNMHPPHLPGDKTPHPRWEGGDLGSQLDLPSPSQYQDFSLAVGLPSAWGMAWGKRWNLPSVKCSELGLIRGL